MKFMVELQLKPGQKSRIFERFEERGPNRVPGITFRGAWIGTRSDVIFVLSEANTEAEIESALEQWSEFGTFQFHPVVDIEQF